MAIQDNYVPTKVLGNGVTTDFSFPFSILAEANIRVYLEEVATGIQTLQTLGVDYTVLDFDDSGGNIQYAVAPTSDYYSIIARDIPINQEVPYTTSAGFQGKVLETSLDKVTGTVQDVSELVGRALIYPLGTTGAAQELPVPEATKVIGYDATASNLILYDNPQVSADAAAASAAAAAASATASAASATAAAASASAASTSETNAATSATAAAASASAAATSATNAATSASNASTSETNAAASAVAAATSETNAATSESNAATSASNAATSESNASTSASNAAASAVAAATSASNAATSETNAAASAAAAAASAAALPTISGGDAGKFLRVNVGETGYDFDFIQVSDLADGTDGELITWDSNGNPATVPVEVAGYVLTSNGAGAPPTFQAAGAGGIIVQQEYTEDGAVATGSTGFPIDDTIPQITEGDEFMTRTITPTNASNILKIDVVLNLMNSGNVDAGAALFKDAVTNALAAIGIRFVVSGALPSPFGFTHYMVAGTTSEITFRVRAGTASGTMTFNGLGGARRFGGVMASSITVTEIAV